MSKWPFLDPAALMEHATILREATVHEQTVLMNRTGASHDKPATDANILDEKRLEMSQAPPHNPRESRERPFYSEDTVWRKGSSQLGTIDRTALEPADHVPISPDWHLEYTRHPDISKKAFKEFLMTGAPPTGSVLVDWNDEYGEVELIPTEFLKLDSRHIGCSDLVRKYPGDPMSGIVVGKQVLYTLMPLCDPRRLGSFSVATDPKDPFKYHEWALYNVPESDLKLAAEFSIGDILECQGWLGSIRRISYSIALRLSNETYVEFENPRQVVIKRGPQDFEVGEEVRIDKDNLRQGSWIHGEYDKNIGNRADVVAVKPKTLAIVWSRSRMDKAPGPRPESLILVQDMENRGVTRASSIKGKEFKTKLWPYGEDEEFPLHEHVRFVDLAAALEKHRAHDENATPAKQLLPRKMQEIPHTVTGGYDLNIYGILRSQAICTVHWQDGSATQQFAQDLEIITEVPDEYELWPGDVVIPRQAQNKSEHFYRPIRIGVVQTVAPKDRMATVLWQNNPDLEFFLEHDSNKMYLAGDSYSGFPVYAAPHGNGYLEEVTVFDVMTAGTLASQKHHDHVLINAAQVEALRARHQAAKNAICNCSICSQPHGTDTLDWFGKVVGRGLNGLMTVRLSGLEEIEDREFPPEALACSLRVAGYGELVDAMGDDDVPDDGVNDEMEMDSSATEEPEPLEVWAEDENGDRVSMEGDEGWSTDETTDSNSDGNVSMGNSPYNDRSEIADVADIVDSVDTVLEASTPNSPPKLSGLGAPERYVLLESEPPADHHFLKPGTAEAAPQKLRAMRKEHKILASSLPEGVFVRSWESRLELFRVLIIGPVDTPYEHAPLLIDIALPDKYPHSPPLAYFHSWTYGQGRVNPNLYEDGKICLSLLNTWSGERQTETWTPGSSTLLQAIVSILGLVLVAEPYYNEAGYESRAGSSDTSTQSAHYTERAYLACRKFIKHALQNDIEPFKEVLEWLYVSSFAGAPKLLDRSITELKIISENEGEPLTYGGLKTVSKAALVMSRRVLQELETFRESLQQDATDGAVMQS
ncbi:hypothetical protein BT63DRAFT_421720 [Microthyrium microscopicum]|uniref:UBC core domain-containing protein n=1 Tax=Microthyrium microscopicum TaxID=703497 RepID=A0A6A6UMT4_9PEZI|nr:hypothetical protein BT63DRAFT_421720 [Microthyrium microscopicum]